MSNRSEIGILCFIQHYDILEYRCVKGMVHLAILPGVSLRGPCAAAKSGRLQKGAIEMGNWCHNMSKSLT